jgi:hypothetical protein
VLEEDTVYLTTNFPQDLGLANRGVLQERYSQKIQEEVVLLSNTTDKLFFAGV